jgi:protein-tyrosine phosphatase
MRRNLKLDWEDCKNVRDLGGLPAGDGRRTRVGALVRSDTPSRLTARGWEALWDYGIRTIITLYTDGHTEPELDLTEVPAGIEVKRVAIEDLGDEEFLHKWASSWLWSTPLYYQDALQKWPQRHAEVIRLFAQAQPGGVLFHCVRGHDRTGIITLLFLSLVGVSAADILADYELSVDPKREELLAGEGTTTRDVILDILASLDADIYLLGAGLSLAEIEAAKERLLEPGEGIGG